MLRQSLADEDFQQGLSVPHTLSASGVVQFVRQRGGQFGAPAVWKMGVLRVDGQFDVVTGGRVAMNTRFGQAPRQDAHRDIHAVQFKCSSVAMQGRFRDVPQLCRKFRGQFAARVQDMQEIHWLSLTFQTTGSICPLA